MYAVINKSLVIPALLPWCRIDKHGRPRDSNNEKISGAQACSDACFSLRSKNFPGWADEGFIYLIEMHGEPVYVGQTENTPAIRFMDHVKVAARGCTRPLYVLIREHGIDAFTVEEVVKADPKDLNTLENEFIRIFRTHASEGLGGCNLMFNREKGKRRRNNGRREC